MLKGGTMIAIRSVVERRLLMNYRVDAEYALRQLPPEFRPQLVHGYAVAGICLLRLGQVRPTALPGHGWGLSSENAAHRYAVEWDTESGTATGVYIARRDSDSLLNVLGGGRLFPGAHGRATFDIAENGNDLSVACTTADGTIKVDVAGTVQPDGWWEGSELFDSAPAATQFFRAGCDGYSPARGGGYEGMRLRSDGMQLRPVAITRALSTVYDAYPAGAATLDCALVTVDTPAYWEPLPRLAR
jgi:hypothetical protein